MVIYQCDCGGTVEKGIGYFNSLLVECMKCGKCGEISFTPAQTKEVIKLQEINKEIESSRKIIKVGSSIAALLPKKIQRYGIQVGEVETVRVLSPQSLEVRFNKQVF